MARRGDACSHPYYWAALVASGRADAPIGSTPADTVSRVLPWIPIVALAVAAAMVTASRWHLSSASS
ncbi:MAG TPA: hypothetical protein VFA27_04010 [Vicinamibacterales bacterium]|nr:hypothetical protein [Vicinamibacterales bacterium]